MEFLKFLWKRLNEWKWVNQIRNVAYVAMSSIKVESNYYNKDESIM